MENNKIPKYQKKKKSSVSKSKVKTKHKHQYKKCILIKDARPYRASYCIVCGKINDLKFGESERMENGAYRQLNDDEVFKKHSDLEQIEINDIRQKFIVL